MKLSEGLSLFYSSMKGVLSDQTIIFYKRRLPSLIESIGDKELDRVTLQELRDWRGCLADRSTKWGKCSTHPEVKGKLSPFTLHQYVRAAKRFFLWCVEEEYIIRNPARRLEKPHLPKAKARGIDQATYKGIVQAAEQGPRASKFKSSPDYKARDKALVMFLADTACRVAGVAGLTVNNLDLAGLQAVVVEKGRGGYGKERTVFFTQQTADQLLIWLWQRAERKIPGDKVFNLSSSGIYQVIKRAATRAEVKGKCNPHSFRHAAISAWLNNGMPISEVAQIAGHSTVRVTADVYGLVPDETLKRDYSRYNWLCKA